MIAQLDAEGLYDPVFIAIRTYREPLTDTLSHEAKAVTGRN